VAVGARDQHEVDLRARRDQAADRVDLVLEVADQIDGDDRDPPALAVEDHAARPEPVVVAGRLPVVAEARHEDRVGVIDGSGDTEGGLIRAGEQRRDRRDVALAGADLERAVALALPGLGESGRREDDAEDEKAGSHGVPSSTHPIRTRAG
jgi:hypothetical protein